MFIHVCINICHHIQRSYHHQQHVEAFEITWASGKSHKHFQFDFYSYIPLFASESDSDGNQIFDFIAFRFLFRQYFHCIIITHFKNIYIPLFASESESDSERKQIFDCIGFPFLVSHYFHCLTFHHQTINITDVDIA